MKKPYRQIKQELLNRTKPKIALYLDMDGVFCGFEQKIKTIFPDFDVLNRKYHDELKSPQEKAVFYKMIKTVASHPNFWSDLPWEPGGKELYKFIKQNKYKFSAISFLTSPLVSDPNCVNGKQEWVMKQFKAVPLTGFIADSKKWNYVGYYAAENQVLIDDRKKNIDLWEQNGGIGILHSSSNVQATIRKLNSLL